MTLDPPQFYAFLRLAGHLLQGKSPRRELAFVAAPVPKPKSILAKRKASASGQQGNPFQQGGGDMDSFMTLMTGGGGMQDTGGKSRKKRVTFDSGPPQVAEAAQRSMSELLRQRQLFNPIPPQAPPKEELEEQQEEPQSEPEPEPAVNSQFENINIDSVLHNGVSSVPPTPPPPRLQPNMTGPVQAEQMGMSMQPGDSFINDLQQKTSNGSLQPQSTGPQLSSVQNQMTGSSQLSGRRGQESRILSPQGSGLQPQNSGSVITPQLSGSQNMEPRAAFSAPKPGNQLQNSGFPMLSPQISGIQPQHSGFQNLSPQGSGLQSQNTGSQMLSPQGSGVGTQAFGTLAPAMQPQYSGVAAPQIQPQFSGVQRPNPSIQLQYYGSQTPAPAPGIQPQYSGIQPQYSGTTMQSQYPGIQPQSSGTNIGLQPPSQGYGANSFTQLAPNGMQNYVQNPSSVMPPHSTSYPSQMGYTPQQVSASQLHGTSPDPAFAQTAYPTGYNNPQQPNAQYNPAPQGFYDFSAMRQQVPRW